MSRNLTDKEIDSVVQIDAIQRYEYLIKHIADQETLWSLWTQGGWVLAADSSGHESVPIWPFREFAQKCATGIWIDYEPRIIAIEDWMNKWTPGMEKDSRLVSVFPTPNNMGVFIEPSRFISDLRQELAHYE